MRDAARYERAGAGAAGCDPIVDLEDKLSTQNVDQFVAVIMEVKRRIGAGGAVSSNAITLAAVSAFCNLSAADLPGDMFQTVPSPG
jgi:hypothetical protein